MKKLFFICLFIFQGCMVSKPKVENMSYATAVFSHTSFSSNCKGCHEVKRPATSTHLNASGALVTTNSHYGTQDCLSCHTPATSLVVPTAWAFRHTPTQSSCVSCHEIKRPAAPHIATGDCVSCHTTANWLSTTAFNHSPTPASCVSCHETRRPVISTHLNASGATVTTNSHYNSQDCASCHTPATGTFPAAWTFKHSPTQSSCVSCHEVKRPAAPHATTGDCVTCHNVTSWATAFNHSPTPTSCLSCHTKDRPAGNISHNSKLVSHYSTLDCKSCHTTPTAQPTASAWSAGASRNCMPCHQSKGVSEHGSSVQNCVQCHNPLLSRWH